MFFVRIGLQLVGLLAVGMALLVMLGLAQRVGWLTGGGVGAAAKESSDVIYTCPMHPHIRQPGPGRCPICAMALEPATGAGGSDLEEFAVNVEPAHRRLANIRTAKVERRPIEQTLSAVGAISIDESRRVTISAYFAGRIERLFADYTGVEVSRGDHLAVLYSPSLYAAQVEYLQSRQSLQETGPNTLATVRRAQQRLAENARQKLVELGMTDAQLSELERTRQAQSRITIYAPAAGTVVEKPAVEGKYIEVGQPIYRIADLSTVWLQLQLYPEDAARIRFGQPVEAEVQSLPGESFQGRVAFINPTVDERTRTTAVRVVIPNPQRKLRPGDYGRATIRVPLGDDGTIYDADLAGKWISPMHPQVIKDEPGECPICGMELVPTSRYGYADQPVSPPTALLVPRDALLMAGPHSLVYVETEPGRFEIRPVKLGPILRDSVVIVEGLEGGEDVATSGNFLIDSQMQLAGKPSLIDPTRAIARPPKKDAPLDFEIAVEPLPGEMGERLEAFYQAYFPLQVALAADRPPTESEVRTFTRAGRVLLDDADVPDKARPKIEEMLEYASHLHRLNLKEGREHFKTISHNALRLAGRYRGERAEKPFIHFWCSMVHGGGGDWLQPSRPPANPYWGDEMLRCVQHEQELPVPSGREEAQETQKEEKKE